MSDKTFLRSPENREPIFPANTTYIPDDLKQRAYSEFSEEEYSRANGIRLFRSMLKEEADFKWQDDDMFLLAFLRTRKFDIKRAFNLMKTFYIVVRRHDELFLDFNVNLVLKTIQQIKVEFLPYKDDEGCAILILPLAHWNPMEISMGDIMRAITSLLLLAIRSPAIQVAGIKIIIDFAGLSLTHIRHVSTSYVRLMVEALQTCFPARFRSIHVVNENFLFSYIWFITRPLLTKKMRDRFHFHGPNIKSLHKFFPRSILPVNLEGELSPIDNSSSLKEAEDNAEYLKYVYSFAFQTTASIEKKGQRRIMQDILDFKNKFF